MAPSVSDLEGSLSMFSTSVRDASGYTASLSSSSSGAKYFGIQEGGSLSVATPRNTTSVLVSDSVSGVDRLTFALTTGATSTSVGANGGAVTTSTSDYGDDFDEGDLNQIAIGLLRTVSATGYFDGRIREILVYTSDQTDNRVAIEANIGEAYNINLPAGVDPLNNEVDGFVDTWYDQSGNGSDAVQATASEQPKIVDSATGALVPGGLLFSGGQTIDTTATFSFASGSSVSLFGVNKATGSIGSYLVKVGTYIIWRLDGGTRRMSLGANANAGSISGNEELWVPIMNVDSSSSGGTGNFFVDGTLTSSADANIGSSVVTNKVLKIGNIIFFDNKNLNTL